MSTRNADESLTELISTQDLQDLQNCFEESSLNFDRVFEQLPAVYETKIPNVDVSNKASTEQEVESRYVNISFKFQGPFKTCAHVIQILALPASKFKRQSTWMSFICVYKPMKCLPSHRTQPSPLKLWTQTTKRVTLDGTIATTRDAIERTARLETCEHTWKGT